MKYESKRTKRYRMIGNVFAVIVMGIILSVVMYGAMIEGGL